MFAKISDVFGGMAANICFTFQVMILVLKMKEEDLIFYDKFNLVCYA